MKIQALLGALSFPPKRGVQTSIAFVVISFYTPFSSNASTLLCAAYGFCISNLRGYILRRVCIVSRVRLVLLCVCLANVLDVGHRIAREGDVTDCNYSMVL